MINQVEGAKGLVKTTTGIDLTTAVNGATVFLQLPPPGQPPTVLVAVRGKLTTGVIERLGKLLGPPVKIGNGAMLELPPGQFPFGAIAVTKTASCSRARRSSSKTGWAREAQSRDRRAGRPRTPRGDVAADG